MSTPIKSSSLFDRLVAAKRKLRDQTRQWIGVEGCGTDGEALRIYVSDEKIAALIPTQVDGFPVKIIRSGAIEAHSHAR